ncbi:hypothetical protein AX14_003846 [Amanita brunnescens Koide BX004]|nr:hypothetical protein AX14_003846 [Amanita brunnescens Koide BX004]
MTTRTGKSALLIAGLMELVLAILSMPSTFLAIFTTAGLERPPQAIGSEGLLVLLAKMTSLSVVFLLYFIGKTVS